jgi:hypothetical protein
MGSVRVDSTLRISQGTALPLSHFAGGKAHAFPKRISRCIPKGRICYINSATV